jgi:signal transduction histidine kinase
VERLVNQADKPDKPQVKSAAEAFRMDRDIGYIELGVVDYSSLAVVHAGENFYGWINRPLGQRLVLTELLPNISAQTVHDILRDGGGMCELEGDFVSRDGVTVTLRIRLIQTGSSAASPLRMLAFDVSELRRKEEILRTVSRLLEAHKNLISESRRTLRAILDSLPQAVFMIDSALTITSETSRVAEGIFGYEITNYPLGHVLGLTERDIEPLNLVFSGVPWHLMAEVLPKEARIKDRILALKFLPVFESEQLISITVIAEDVTEQRRIIDAFERKNAESRAIVAILSAKDEFLDLLEMVNQLGAKASSRSDFRAATHSIKGGFSFLECEEFVGLCHTAETELNSERYDPSKALHFASELRSRVNEFARQNRAILQLDGDIGELSPRRRVQVDSLAVEELYRQALSERVSPKLLELARGLVEVPVSSQLAWLDKVWIKTLERGGKVGHPIEWSGDLSIPRESYKELMQSFVHLVRNAADHGIEQPEQREREGKDRFGRLKISATTMGENYQIVFSDDGAGIDPDRIVSIARSRGMRIPEGISRQEALMLVCEPDFSSRATVTEISGQGIGVDAVRRAAKACGGDVIVSSELGKGTSFTVWIPRSEG